MTKPSKQDLDKIRKQGFRAQVVGCFLNCKKLLFLFNEKYNLWQLPQGGIDNQETIDQAFSREMTEELGKAFMKAVDKNLTLVGEDQIIFPIATQGSRNLKTDNGETIFLKGKKYFFITVAVNISDIKIESTEFDDYKWVSFSEGMVLANKIYQKGKQRVTIKILNVLKESELLF